MATPATLADSEPHRGAKPPRNPFLWPAYPAMGKPGASSLRLYSSMICS
ncbi:hypothetical protein QE435_005020 [Rhizobium sp. SORGH_AS 787]|nr:hypothetical protein [Rhizobium sp. SORGH_AS_0787]